VQRRGEFDLIAQVFAPLAAGAPGAYALGDDAATVQPAPGQELVVTTDAMVRGVHFDHRTAPADVGRKLLRVNLSDLAAKGAEPIGYVLTTAWSPDVTDEWIVAFASGLKADQDEFGVHLLGGDTVATPQDLVLSITVFGQVPRGTMLRRAGALDGDDIYVSGTIGDACLGLQVAAGTLVPAPDDARALRQRLDRPTPRVQLGRALRDVAHAALDVSDGLLGDLDHLCEQSHLGAEVHLDRVPLSAAALAVLAVAPGERNRMLTFGDDYELVFTAAPRDRGRIEQAAASVGVPVTRIGAMRPGHGVRVVDASGVEVSFGTLGYRHF
jgi:thiamine-monophosphate kinase